MSDMLVAGTGHRPDKLGGFTDAVERRLHTVATRWLEDNRPHIKYVISGMALGWDQALAQAAIDLGIRYHAYIPFEGMESKWPRFAQAKYKALLNRADQIIIVSPGAYAGYKMQKRNIAMVDNCTHVLALWNGSADGTANCIEYAEYKKRPIINLWKRFEGLP